MDIDTTSSCESECGTDYTHRIHLVCDRYTEKLPTTSPLPYSFFRYLGFQIKTLEGKVVKLARTSLTMKVTTEDGELFTTECKKYFKNGIYYFQNVELGEGTKFKMFMVL